MRETEPAANASRCLLTSLDIHRGPNPRTCLWIRTSQDYRQQDRQFNLLDILILCNTPTAMHRQPAQLDL
jgi:hypothetical protein